MTSSAHLLLDGDTLTLEEIARVVARTPAVHVDLTPAAREGVHAARALVDRLAEKTEPVYGINTGFGTLAEIRIPRGDLRTLQRNLILSHACGVGAPLTPPQTRALMLLRANVLAKGYSGIRASTLDLLLSLLNLDILPIVPSRGSVGASGDLAPLAHLALVLIGEGEALLPLELGGGRVSGREALSRAGLAPVVLEAKEGLALVNGTQAMQAVGTLALLDAERTARMADLAGAFTLEGLLGSHHPFEDRIHAIRPHEGQRLVATNLRALLADSPIHASHQGPGCAKVQDPYSLRCMPQVHGSARDALAFARRTLEIEINSATDNPLVFADAGEIISNGNFHGQPVSQALDLVAMACVQLMSISERRMEQLVNPSLSGLPPFLTKNSGLNSGYMIAQVTSAALVAESRILAHPACVDTIPSSAGREDHVSMGMTAALKAATVTEFATQVIAIELLTAAQALWLRLPLLPGVGVRAAYETLRAGVPPMESDREIHRDMAAVAKMIETGTLERALGAAGVEVK